jgi:hypothetical protein
MVIASCIKAMTSRRHEMVRREPMMEFVEEVVSIVAIVILTVFSLALSALTLIER